MYNVNKLKYLPTIFKMVNSNNSLSIDEWFDRVDNDRNLLMSFDTFGCSSNNFSNLDFRRLITVDSSTTTAFTGYF